MRFNLNDFIGEIQTKNYKRKKPSVIKIIKWLLHIIEIGNRVHISQDRESRKNIFNFNVVHVHGSLWIVFRVLQLNQDNI